MTAEAPPDLSTPAPPDVEDTAQPKDPVPPPEALKPKPVKKPPPPKKPPAEKPKADTQKQDFAALLRNLTPDATQAQQDAPDLQLQEPQYSDSSQIARIADRLTMSEEDALRRQLSRCWNFPIGARNPEELVVEVRLQINPDRTVNSARIVDNLRYSQNSFYRAAADSALRALRNPSCSPLELPQDKYHEWKDIIVRFDPRDLL